MDAAERAKYITHWYADDRIIGVRPELLYDKCLAQFRQAEQAARRDEREKVLEEACKAQCQLCGHGGVRSHWDARVGKYTHGTNSFGMIVACEATEIRRALKET